MAWYNSMKDFRKGIKRTALGALTGGLSEQRNSLMDPYRDITGITAQKNAERSAEALAAQQAQEEAQALADQYAAIEKERKKRARMQGRQSTILAGGSSLGMNDLSVMRKTLLGG